MTRLIVDGSRLRIRVCGGMNCSAGGGGRPLEAAFQQEIDRLGLTDRVEILRAHCLGECHSGPCVRISGERFYCVQPSDVPQIVQEEVLPKL